MLKHTEFSVFVFRDSKTQSPTANQSGYNDIPYYLHNIISLCHFFIENVSWYHFVQECEGVG